HAAFDNVAHAELAPDLAHIAALALELEDRGACHHVELRNFRQDVEQFLGHAVREIVLVQFATDVDEREDGDRIVAGGRRRSHVAFAERWLAVKIPAQSKYDEQHGGGEQALTARSADIELHAL